MLRRTFTLLGCAAVAAAALATPALAQTKLVALPNLFFKAEKRVLIASLRRRSQSL